MLMRIYLGEGSHGGPCALELKTGMGDAAIGLTLETWCGMFRSTERLAASAFVSEAVFGFLRE